MNVTSALSVSLPFGDPLQSASFKPATTNPAAVGGTHALLSGWNLIATGDSPTPAQFSAAIATANSIPPSAGQASTNLNTLWAWDVTKQNWYFWAPSLANSGALAGFINSRSYLDSSNMPGTTIGVLSSTTGFWVNVP